MSWLMRRALALCAATLLAIAGIVVYEIAARYLFDAPTIVAEFDAAGRADFQKRTQPMYDEFYRAAGDSGRSLVKYVQSLKQ